MSTETSFVDMMLIILGKENYYQLIKKISKECQKWKLDLDTFAENILNKHCFLIFMIGMSKKIEIEKYIFRTDKQDFEIESSTFAEIYEEYIKMIENKKFEIAKSMI